MVNQLKELLSIYGPLDLDTTIITYMWNSATEEEKWRLGVEEEFFFSRYQEFSYLLCND